MNRPYCDATALFAITGESFGDIFVPTDEEINSPNFSQTPECLCFFVTKDLRGVLFKGGAKFYWRFCNNQSPPGFEGDDSSRTVYRIEGPMSLPDIIREAEEKGSFGKLTKIQEW